MKDVIKKILITLGILILFKLGSVITVPNVDIGDVKTYLSSGTFLTAMNMITGGSLETFSIFALGVGPYINASIVIQILCMVIPPLKELSEEGGKGRAKMEKITKATTLVIAIIQALSLTLMFQNSYEILEDISVYGIINVVIMMVAGMSITMWLADVITAYGVGNGASVIIFTGIISGLPSTFKTVYETLMLETNGTLKFILYCVVYVLLIVAICFVETSERRILIQQSNRVVNKTKGDFNYIPLKINSAGVMPVIFASTLLSAPSIIANLFGKTELATTLSEKLSLSSWLGIIIFGLLIVMFSFFYTSISINPTQMADNLKKNGTYIPGIRPGFETEKYIKKVLYSITCLGTLCLLIIALMPSIIAKFTSLSSNVALGGTGLIVAVGVAIEIKKNIQTILTNKSYQKYGGF